MRRHLLLWCLNNLKRNSCSILHKTFLLVFHIFMYHVFASSKIVSLLLPCGLNSIEDLFQPLVLWPAPAVKKTYIHKRIQSQRW